MDVERRFATGRAIAASFDVALAGGSVLVLFGPSGAGKTTVLRILAGLERPDAGVVRFGDRVWVDTRAGMFVPPQARRIGYVLQQPALFPHLTVRANVAFGVSVGSAAERARRADRLLTRLGVAALADRHPRALSGGEAQRAALARALAPSPDLLLLDEPFAAVDAPGRARMRADLRALLKDSRLPAVLVTHDRTEALALGDHIAVLVDGRVRQVGPVADILSRPRDLDVARAVGVETVLAASVAAADRGLLTLRIGSAALRAAGADDDIEAGRDVFACIRAEDVVLEQHAAAGTSARNHLPGRIVAIEPEGALERVTLDCGFPLVALITRQSREDLRLAEGSQVAAAIKATSIHIVARS